VAAFHDTSGIDDQRFTLRRIPRHSFGDDELQRGPGILNLNQRATADRILGDLRFRLLGALDRTRLHGGVEGREQGLTIRRLCLLAGACHGEKETGDQDARGFRVFRHLMSPRAPDLIKAGWRR